MLAHIFGEEPQHEVTVFLQEKVFAPVATVSLGISQMLTAVELDSDAGIRT